MSNQKKKPFQIQAFNPDKTWRILEYLSQNAYIMVLHKYGERLYSGLVTTMTRHLKEISSSIESAQGDSFLEELNHKWAEHNKALQMIRDMLMYMDRTFVPSTHKTPVYELGLNLWRDNVIHSSNIQTRLLNTLLELIQKERTGEVINRGLMRNIIKMLMDLGASVYQEDFEKPFLEESANFYRVESEEFIEYCDCGGYLKKAETRLNEEIERVSHYLDLSSELKITKVVEREMIANHMSQLVHMENSGLMVVNILLDDKYEDLGRMCNLFCRVEDGFSTIREVMSRHLKEISRSIESAQGDSFLEELNHKWALYNKALQMILPSTHKTPVYELVLNLWRDIVIHSSNIQTRLSNTLLELIQKERTGEVINRGLMRNIIKMLMDLGASVYQEDFEKPFLEESAKLYRHESEEFIRCCDCGDYLKRAERRLNEEIERVSHYLDLRSELKITKVVEREMIANCMHRLVHMEDSGLVNMLRNDKCEDLERMCKLFSRVEHGLSTIRDVMTSHLRETGKQLVTDLERVKDTVEFVQRLLDEKVKYEDKYYKIITSAFINGKTFQNALNSFFEYLINLNPRSPELISLFVDYKLRKGRKGVSDEDVGVVLDKVIMLVQYLQDKDVFGKYYKQHLAKRLLSGKTVSDDAERSLIVKLKTECDCQFTSKLDGMFTDMKTSQDTIQGFCASHGAELGDSPTLVVQVLTTGSWPIQPSFPCNLPAELSLVCEKFRSYYLGTHTGRRLSWQTNMGTAHINATFSEGQKHELNVSTFQMCVLMLFNNADKLSYREIEQATEIPAPELKRCLQSLACVKGKNILRKEPMSKDIGENDVFLFNDKFSSKFYKVKIGTVVAQKESEPEKQETRQKVEEDRKSQIEGAIVRIMKSRKVLDHNNIIAEVTKQLQSRFLPNPVEIKKRIESLIEREFLERDSADRKLYRYLA